MRLKLVPSETNWDIFGKLQISLGLSSVLIVLSVVAFAMFGLNFGIDFRGGTTVRTETNQDLDIGAYRDAMQALDLGDITISEVFDPAFGPDRHVAMIRIQALEGQEAVTADVIERVEAALGALTGGAAEITLTGRDAQAARVAPMVSAVQPAPQVQDMGDAVVLRFDAGLPAETRASLTQQMSADLSLDRIAVAYSGFKIVSVESVGPKVSGELIQKAVLAVALAIAVVLFYIWLRFEWQFAVGAVAALVHDVVLTIGVFAAFQIRFDLAIIAALLTIVGYSLNDTVVVFDRVRENLRKYKQRALKDVLNLSINETLSRTFMTSVTTLLALIALLVLGGDVIRGFVFAMTWGVVVGTYSSIYVASAVLLWLGVKRDWSKPDATSGTQFANVDA